MSFLQTIFWVTTAQLWMQGLPSNSILKQFFTQKFNRQWIYDFYYQKAWKYALSYFSLH